MVFVNANLLLKDDGHGIIWASGPYMYMYFCYLLVGVLEHNSLMMMMMVMGVVVVVISSTVAHDRSL